MLELILFDRISLKSVCKLTLGGLGQLGVVGLVLGIGLLVQHGSDLWRHGLGEVDEETQEDEVLWRVNPWDEVLLGQDGGQTSPEQDVGT